MIGVVTSRIEATLRLKVFGGAGASAEVNCIVDTGFSGAITLPRGMIQRLNLRWLSIQDSELADGHIIQVNVYAGTVIWNRRRVNTEIDETETDPLLGMSLLKGFDLYMQVQDGGVVRVTPLA